ncbi:MAG: 16S rRNA (cytidine(1402)-2'-O)-methyltransferase [Opitutae bacterium]|nr:16S rRNA (cytidine(1402)-2'-O)-methyltransferase [Opitutae bacterium]
MTAGGDSVGVLYLVATPIGNLSDISSRACDSLDNCDLIACEDTRVTKKLLDHLSLSKPLVSYREENEVKKTTELADLIEQGKSAALVSDAGYPGISDPGFRLVRECRVRGIEIVPVPGPNAAITVLAASGLPTHQFLFLGFLPKKSAGARKALIEWKDFGGSLILYEAKYRIEKTLGLIEEELGGERTVCVAREVTKLHESFLVGTATEIIKRNQASSSKGEFTLVIAPEGYAL